MGWRSLIVTQHCKVTTKNRTLVVQTDSEVNNVPIEDINQVVFTTTRALLSADAITTLAEANAKVIFSGRDGQPVTETTNLYSDRRKADLVRLQVNWPKSLVENLWTKIVAAKVSIQAQVTKLCGYDNQSLLDDLDTLEINDHSNRERLQLESISNSYSEMTFHALISVQQMLLLITGIRSCFLQRIEQS